MTNSRSRPRFPRPKLYNLLVQSIETASNYASYRAWKHSNDLPNEEERQRIARVFERAIMDQLCEDFEVDERKWL